MSQEYSIPIDLHIFSDIHARFKLHVAAVFVFKFNGFIQIRVSLFDDFPRQILYIT